MFVLARDLNRTRAELGVQVSARELAWWQALYEIEAAERAHAEEMAKQRRRGRRG